MQLFEDKVPTAPSFPAQATQSLNGVAVSWDTPALDRGLGKGGLPRPQRPAYLPLHGGLSVPGPQHEWPGNRGLGMGNFSYWS